MAEYKFYSIKKDGHIDGPPVEAEYPRDAEALVKAKELVNGNDIEVWQGKRVVAYLTPEEK